MGEGFSYFTFVPEIADFEDNLPNNLWLFKGNNPKLKTLYSTLSKYVHSGGPFLQTRTGRFTPKYDQDEFLAWCETFKTVQKYVNILFVLCFIEGFKKMSAAERDQILQLAIGNDYKEPIKQVCGL